MKYLLTNISFIRYYHHSKIPTRYFASRDGRIYSEISDTIMKPGTNITKQYHFPESLYRGPNNKLSFNIKEKIMELYLNKVPAKEIQQVLDIDSIHRIYHAIYDEKYKRKVECSTTIDQL